MYLLNNLLIQNNYFINIKQILFELTGQNSFSFAISGKTNPLDTNQEFQMQNEDFPALPGSNQPQQGGESAVNTAIGSIGTMPGPPISGTQSSSEGKENTASEAVSYTHLTLPTKA